MSGFVPFGTVTVSYTSSVPPFPDSSPFSRELGL